MGIVDFAHNLKQDEQGIWTSNSGNRVSYPQGQHGRCLQIEDRSFWFRHRNDCIIAAIRKFPPSGTILDIGGGNGFVARRILDEGYDCTLLEPGPDGALNAKHERDIPEVICSTLEGAQFEAGSLAAVGMFDVIEHIDDDRGMIDRIHQLLRPQGLFYCTVPAHQWLWSMHDVSAGHKRRYNRAGVEELLAGRFELLYFSYFFSALVAPMFFLKALPFRLLGRGGMLSQPAEHATGSGAGRKVLNNLLGKEVDRIRTGRHGMTGTSCLVVARKT